MRFLSPLFFLAALFAQESAEFRNWLNQGAQAFREVQYAAAIQAFQRAIDLNPSSLTAHLYLATAYMQQYIPGVESNENSQVTARAKEAFSQVLVFDPTNKVALASMASLYLNEKKWDDAQQWYEKLIAADPRNADAYYSLGFTAWSKWFPAYQAARASAGLKPDDQGPSPDSGCEAGSPESLGLGSGRRDRQSPENAGAEPTVRGRYVVHKPADPRTCRSARYEGGMASGHCAGRSVASEAGDEKSWRRGRLLTTRGTAALRRHLERQPGRSGDRKSLGQGGHCL